MILDGGRTVHRYTCKAFGVGADFVVVGGALAGIQTNEACERFMLFHGMSSKFAQENYSAGETTSQAFGGKLVKASYRVNFREQQQTYWEVKDEPAHLEDRINLRFCPKIRHSSEFLNY